MKSMKNSGITKQIVLLVIAVVCVVTFICNYINILNNFQAGKAIPGIQSYANCIFIVFLLLYAFVTYKVPHGNLLRILFFVFGMALAFSAVLDVLNDSPLYVSCGCSMFVALMMAYISGRLNKFDKDIKLLLVAVIILLVGSIVVCCQVPDGSFTSTVAIFTKVICLCAMSLTYIIRFADHKEAGVK